MNSNRIRRDLGRQIRDFKYETDGEGNVLLPQSGLLAYGVFDVENLTRGGKSIAPNLVVTEGLNHILAVVLGATSKVSTWYLAPFAGNVTPSASWDASNFDANATEFTNYDEAARQEFVDGSVSGGSINNLSSKAEITIAGGAQDTIWGVGLLSSATKEGTAGVLLSAAKLASSRDSLQDGDTIALGYTFTVTDAG